MMVFYTKLYYWYRTALLRSIRLVVFCLLFFVLVYAFLYNISPKIPQFLFNIFIIFEVFFHYKVSKAIPDIPIDKNKGKDTATLPAGKQDGQQEIYQSFTREALYGFITQNKTSGVVKEIVKSPQVRLVMQKANIAHKDLVFADVAKNILAQSAFDTASTFRGTFVTTLDVFAAYLFLTEKDTKLLFAKQLKAEDLYTIIFWVKSQMSEEENPKKLRVHFSGGGIGEALISGWTPETKKYTANFSSQALREKPFIAGREAEFKTMLEGLIKVEGNNVLLVGDIGAGKENLVRALGYYSFEGELHPFLNYKRVYQLLVGALTAGATNRNDLESRLQEIIAEISHANDVIMYIPYFENIVGATSYNLDLSGALLPYLQGGAMPIIATMTTGTFKTYMEKNPLKEVFTVVQLKEPEKSTAIHMVLSESKQIEKKYHVILSYQAVASAVELADRFLQDEVLPGSAISLLENVANTVALAENYPFFERTQQRMVLRDQVVKRVEDTVHVHIATPSKSEIDLLLHLEDRLHERIIDQVEAVTAISEAMRRIRSGMATNERPISFLFLGPTGVGKTETAKTLADFYFGGEKNMIRLDMSEYTDEMGVRRLLGAPPGEGDERGELTDKIHDNPASLVLLDEFEKANPKIHNLFLQVLDDGRLTDNKGKTVSFRNSIIIATSNAGSEFIREEIEKGTKIDKQFMHRLLDYLQKNALFKPELLNRFDDVITFKPLGDAEATQIIKLMLREVTKTLTEQDITITFDDAVITKIAEEGLDKEFGARPLRRYIQDNIEDLLAKKKLANEITRGKKVNCFINGTGSLDLAIT